MTRAEVMAAREAEGFVTPISPIEPGRPWCVFESRGTYELMCHPADAEILMRDGIVFDGKRIPFVDKVGEWPMIGAYQLVFRDPDANKEFTPSVHAVADSELAESA